MSEDGALFLARARLGEVLRGKYRLDSVLGIGGMAVVYAATHRNQKRFAVKVLHAELSTVTDIRTRFLREGYVANSVEHPGAVAVLDDDVAEDGAAFIVMELLQGAPVDQIWDRYGKRVPLALAMSIGEALLDVLAAAHAKGIVHRDIKPANVFLTSEGRLAVLDFGIARLHDAASSAASATQTGALMGSPAYMAPEQALAESRNIDAQTDLWAVGATLFALITGEFVHPGDNAPRVLVNAATKAAREISSVSEDVPKKVAAVIDKALAFQKKDRWASATEMREALVAACIEVTGAPPLPLPRTKLAAPSDAGRRVVLPQTTGVAVSRSQGAGSKATPRRSLLRLGSVAALAGVVLASGVAAYRAAHAPRAHYCLGVEYGNDGPRCVIEVGADIVGKRFAVVPRITEVGGRVARLEYVNFAGLVDEQDAAFHQAAPFARQEVLRDESGAVRELVAYDNYGAVLEHQRWSDGGTKVDYVDLDGKTPRHWWCHDLETPVTRFTSERVEYDERGLRRRTMFFGPTGRPRAWIGPSLYGVGVYGIAYEFGETPGLRTKTTFLGADGAPAPDELGVGALQRSRDDGVFWGDQSTLDVRGRPLASYGVYTRRILHDDHDVTGWVSLGLHGEPATFLLQSYHEARFAWDGAKRTREIRNFDEQGRPVAARGLWFWSMRTTFDDRGRLVLREFLDPQGNRSFLKNGASAHRFAYDARDHQISNEWLDSSGALMRGEELVAREEDKRDAHDNPLERRYYDDAGRLAPSSDGGAIVREIFDERDLLLSISNFGADDRPVTNVHGVSSERRRYDRLRNLVEEAYFGADGKPTASDEGFALRRFTYDENDDLVSVAYFDAAGAPTSIESSYATKNMRYDDRGLLVEEAYLDAQGEPILTKDGYASERRRRDREGDVVEEEYFGKGGEPTLRAGGFAGRLTSYDVIRRPVEEVLLDAAGAPVRGDAGWAIERKTYDERGLATRVDHLDASNAPALDRDGRASLVKTYDRRGMPTEEMSLDAAGAPISVASLGYATRRIAYDGREEMTEEAVFDAQGKPVMGREGWALRRVHYDDFENEVEEAFFDGAHDPVAPIGLGYASRHQRFDERRRLIESAYLDVRGAPCPGPDGVAIVRYERDGYGRATQVSYLDGTGAPALSKGGKSVVRFMYDAAGRVVAERSVDCSGAPLAAADGCSGHYTRYDGRGRKVEESCLDAHDASTLSTDGWAMRRTLHDARGNEVDVATYDAEGTLHADKRGIARTKNRFDERNVLVETTLFDANEKPVHEHKGP